MPRTSSFSLALIAVIVLPWLVPEPAAAEEIAPPMYSAGNLRVALVCAGELVSGRDGLEVRVDGGPPIKTFKSNVVTGTYTDENGNTYTSSSLSDVGFLVAPGMHRVRLFAPDCAPMETLVDVSATHETRVDATLPIVEPSLQGTTGAPDGFGLVLGGFTASFPRALAHGVDGEGSYGSTHEITDATTHGVLLSTSLEHRHFVFANEMSFGWGRFQGTVMPDAPTALGAHNPGPAGPFAMSGSLYRMAATLRFGARFPFHDVSWALGSGLGGSLYVLGAAQVDPGSERKEDIRTGNLSSLHALWHVPLWTSVTFKPSCDFGLQVGVSYDVEPTNFDGNTLMLSAGLLVQPSRACREPPSLTVTP